MPHGTPKLVISRLNSEIVKAVGDPAVRDRLVALGLDPASSTPEQLAEDTRNGFAKMGKVIRAAGIKAE